jgi:hypothetical protein
MKKMKENSQFKIIQSTPIFVTPRKQQQIKSHHLYNSVGISKRKKSLKYFKNYLKKSLRYGIYQSFGNKNSSMGFIIAYFIFFYWGCKKSGKIPSH